LRQQFLAAYEAVYQYVADDALEVVNLRLLARGVRAGKLDFTTLSITGAAQDNAPASIREVYFGRNLGWSRTEIVDHQTFTGTARGPLILQSSDSTVVVPPGGVVKNDGLGNLLIELGEGPGQ
ncbi:MAG: hydantoinase/oxoprolinase family protein, partial [Alphaproteobacteria bacterium]|nr:hydantoinase/oxoprolinase family protein [Alphaproteobacteria bacterium]